ncbi:26S proteasome non-ATPase regulatory subunit 13 [Octopus bimaculoides]|uniref:26S proteasome non-ATPase regulatory subunit 13 n=1 Tax=Octopus bimaculoides TaxID=37653 RepID=A0A0L8FS14_OCTBM|nr:26S proteasome non-ATPase regulatory subunit 13 [Octopus bimaculoides]|eukprot:XP_014787453.1 PREDICTED: 26S proteasome non-ATPase regulatory subunit 13-like [Octopus bimaculoides]
MPKDIAAYLDDQQKNSSGQITHKWTELEELYNKKLWHQLTLKLQDFVKDPIFSTGDGLIKLYENFISDFEHRINSLALVELVIQVVKQISDANQAVEFLEKIKEKIKSNEEAKILVLTTIATLKLKSDKLEDTKKIIEEARELLEGLDGVTSVHGRFYNLSSSYLHMIHSHAPYYKDALRFLGCIDMEDIPVDEKQQRAYQLGISALLGDGVYNFGELLAHPIVNSLTGTNREWLVQLLYAFNSGNLAKFDSLKTHWAAVPELVAEEVALKQKIRLLCLMEMTFSRPATSRQLSFADIAREADIPLYEVEPLVMKALSLGLVCGHIDQVDEKVYMTWVQPRVLDLTQVNISLLRDIFISL